MKNRWLFCVSARKTLLLSRAYTYDAMGNRTDHSATTGSGNRLFSFTGISMAYDADGNMNEKYRAGVSDTHYYWSAESRLDSAVDNLGSGVEYEYNALGKPVIRSKKTLGGSWSIESYYVWDGDQLMLELDGSGNRRADYTYYPGTIDQPAAEELGATSVTEFRDHQIDGEGNVIGTVSGTSVSQQVKYDAWGTPAVTGTTMRLLVGIGDRATIPVAVAGAFTAGYNLTIATQCALGRL